jgi:hypothetical protein
MIERRALLTGVAAAVIMQLAPSEVECAECHVYTVAFESVAGTVHKVYHGLFLPEILDQAEFDAEGMILTDIWRGIGAPPSILDARRVDFVKPPLLPVCPEPGYLTALRRSVAGRMAEVLEIAAPPEQASADELRQWVSRRHAAYEAARA